MSKTVIKVENVSKLYRLGAVSSGSISHDVNRWWHRVLGKEDPYLKICEVNDRTQKGDSDYVWALREVNFEVKEGEVLGIIGRNGAGKSTLLKILSRTTAPTSGNIKVRGRIASLLEVGTGFHPELTGRENVYLNGAILGMTKGEISRKFDEIIDFAGVERYIDTPVKRYSSGMYVRLAFAVAAFLEPDILIVDEVLAVGDVEFQKRCLGRMKEVSTNEGRTILFVSHNLVAIQELCSSCIYMETGMISMQGQTVEVLKPYLKRAKNFEYVASESKVSKDVYLQYAKIENNTFQHDGFIKIELEIYSHIEISSSIDIRIHSNLSIPIAFSSIGTFNYDEMIELKVGKNKVVLSVVTNLLAIGEYNVSIDLTQPNIKYLDRCNDCLSFEILTSGEDDRRLNQAWNLGFIQLPIR